MTISHPGRADPIGERFYKPLHIAEAIEGFAFYAAAALSIAALLIDKAAHASLYGTVQVAFALSVLVLFVGTLAVRLYWSSRAQGKRFADFLSHAFDLPLIAETSTGYYHNGSDDPFVRMAASLLENTLFTRTILERMLLSERAKVSIYAVVWFLALSYRSTDLALLALIAQVVLGEQMIARWVRMEWLRLRTEGTYDDVYALLQGRGGATSREFRARIVQALLRYETDKGQGGISLSTRVFNQLNPSLSAAWDRTRGDLTL